MTDRCQQLASKLLRVAVGRRDRESLSGKKDRENLQPDLLRETFLDEECFLGVQLVEDDVTAMLNFSLNSSLYVIKSNLIEIENYTRGEILN
ncbi:hypothetical protein BY996DRAFT_6531768 [Phakopsora pachyrhizi]|uniref:Expressed protein n=1 Tax=Phakopsora pachyrhizi TaxID=170000 RepID=A0AAV0BBG9_PHAPC|nr:hypothetical protein BY996DRAFT_6531768 [Phakopsora pachyrhizi]CAH7684634.1 expressed protein [Phakopsora pachyrhizi]